MEYRVYENKLGIRTPRYERIFTSLEDAKAAFERVKQTTNSSVALQQLNPKWHWVDKELDYYEVSDWKQRQEDYWKRREAEDESELWHAGDSPWRAPGMKVSDFI